jgi:hypothetical protein
VTLSVLNHDIEHGLAGKSWPQTAVAEHTRKQQSMLGKPRAKTLDYCSYSAPTSCFRSTFNAVCGWSDEQAAGAHKLACQPLAARSASRKSRSVGGVGPQVTATTNASSCSPSRAMVKPCATGHAKTGTSHMQT